MPRFHAPAVQGREHGGGEGPEVRTSDMTVRDDMTTTDTGWRARVELTLRRPLVLALASVTLIAVLAVLYLNQVAGAAVANSALRELNAQQTRLERQDATLHQQLGAVTSPAYVDQQARALGLAPASGTPPTVITLDIARIAGAVGAQP